MWPKKKIFFKIYLIRILTFGKCLVVERSLALEALEALLVIVAELPRHLLSLEHLEGEVSIVAPNLLIDLRQKLTFLHNMKKKNNLYLLRIC